ncbi:MAG: SRPBCC domain-containing protein [Bacteroidetes bacterium]|nr:SRPBCC domain-containing protein [Bacteroidota bacterium]
MSEKVKYEMEFPIKASPSLLYQYISTPSGMSEWYADNVNSRGEFFTFIWEGSEERAKLLGKKSGERIKFRWEDDEEEGDDYYFELRIQVDDITKDVSLMVTDFADDDEIDEGKMLWDNMVSNLKHVLGST